MNACAYENFAKTYDLSVGLFGEHQSQGIEFFRQLFAEDNVANLC